MDGDFRADAALAVDFSAETMENPVVETTSTEFLGRWNHLVSTTNWEKGRIISEWRAALIEAGAPAAVSTDDAWSSRVGNVTPQHVGRLRRVYQRFGEVRDQYVGLFWSHFQATLDWADAEMWLEGAVQNGWSISQMHNERAKTLSMVEPLADDRPAAPVELDEDAPFDATGETPSAISGMLAEIHDAGEDADSRDGEPWESVAEDADILDAANSFADEPVTAVRPFENLPQLPQDLADAFEAFKLAIVHHRLTGWQEASCDDVLASLDALRQLALAPIERS